MQCLYRCRPACQTCSTLKKNKKLKTVQTDESVQQTEDVRKVAILQGEIDVAVMLEQNADTRKANREHKL